jgi:hypothetical protein
MPSVNKEHLWQEDTRNLVSKGASNGEAAGRRGAFVRRHIHPRQQVLLTVLLFAELKKGGQSSRVAKHTQ